MWHWIIKKIKNKKKKDGFQYRNYHCFAFNSKLFPAANGLPRDMIKYTFCYTLHIQQNLSAVLERKAVPCSSSCARHCKKAVWFSKRCQDMSDFHSGHILALFCGAEDEERFAELLAWSLVFKKAEKPISGKSLEWMSLPNANAGYSF